jgi:hypothetical protein
VLALGLALAALFQEGAAAGPPGEIAAADLARWHALVRPRERELAWERIPWIPSFAEGLACAAAEGRPLLFWAMNGHPLGCT